MAKAEPLYVNPFNLYAECTFTKTEVRDAILGEAYDLAMSNNVSSLKEIMKLLPKTVARSVPLSSVVTKKEIQEALGMAQETMRERELDEKNRLTEEEKKVYIKLYRKCNGKPPSLL